MNRQRSFLLIGSIAFFVALGLSMAVPKNPKDGSLFKHGSLVIDDVDVAEWMTINNTFNPFAEAYWEGVLIQVGDHLNEDGASFALFESIQFVRKGSILKELFEDDFNWINIVAVDPGRGIPMEPEHLGLLFPVLDPNQDYSCGDFDRCARLNCGTPNPNLPLFQKCLRQQSLHGFFSPIGIITYWQGPNGFDVSVRIPGSAEHGSHTFTFNDEVQIFKDGELLKLGKIDSIHVRTDPNPGHGGKHDPGW